jgi:hypothetical protein
MSAAPVPVVFIPRPVDPLRRLAALGRAVPLGRLQPGGTRLARRLGQRGADQEERGGRRGQGHRRYHRRLPRRHRPPAGQADRDRPLVWRPHRAEAAVRGRGRRGCRDQSRPEASAANFKKSSPAAIDTRKRDRGPLPITGGGDHTVPEVVARAAYNLYAGSGAVTDYHAFPDRGHSLVLDHGWREVADLTLSWLAGQGL